MGAAAIQFKYPLILGASMSADLASLSPGKKLCLRYTDTKNIRTIARKGRMGRELVPSITPGVLRDRSIAIGLDLFFWDSAQSQLQPSIIALEEMISRTVKAKIPLVLGDIPELLPGRQPGRVEMNAAIHSLTSPHPTCFVVSFDQLYREYLRQGYLTIRGEKMTLREIIPDGLHVSDLASDYLSEVLLATLRDTVPTEAPIKSNNEPQSRLQ